MLNALVVGQPYLDLCRKYKEETIKARTVIYDYVKSIGGEEVWADHQSGLTAVRFPIAKDCLNRRAVPEGWSAPSRKSGASAPKKTSKDIIAQIDALPRLPDPYEVYQGIPLDLHYTYDDMRNVEPTKKGEKMPEVSPTTSKASHGMLDVYEPQVEWFLLDGEDTFILHIPDVAMHIERVKDYGYSNLQFQDDIESWTLPEGLTIISDIKRKYLLVKSQLQREEAREADET